MRVPDSTSDLLVVDLSNNYRLFDFSAKYESNMFSVYFSVYLAFLKSTHEYFCIGN